MEIRPLALVMRRNRGSLSAHRGALECHRDKYTNTQIHKDKYTKTNTQTHIYIYNTYTQVEIGACLRISGRETRLCKKRTQHSTMLLNPLHLAETELNSTFNDAAEYFTPC